MKLYIFNKQNGIQSADFYENEISENVLWSGESWESFNKETGLTEKEIGGIVKIKDKLGFSIELKAEGEKQKNPLAMGKDLVEFLNDYRSGMGPDNVKALLTKLSITYLLLQNSGFNPFTQETFDYVLKDLDSVLNENAKLVKEICLGWAKTVRFAENDTKLKASVETAKK